MPAYVRMGVAAGEEHEGPDKDSRASLFFAAGFSFRSTSSTPFRNRLWLFIVLQDCCNLLLQHRYVFDHGFVYRINIHAKIMMHDKIPHTCNVFSRNIGVYLSKVRRKMLCSFADHLNLLQYRVLQKMTGRKRFPVHPIRIFPIQRTASRICCR